MNGTFTQPATTYQVTPKIFFVRDTTCAGSAGVVFSAVAITTNAAGDGSGHAFFLPSGVPAILRNATMASSIRSPIRRVSSTAAAAW